MLLIEDWLAKQDEKIEKEVEKARKRFGETFDEAAKYRETSPRVAETAVRRDEMQQAFRRGRRTKRRGREAPDHRDCEITRPIFGTRN